MTSHASRTHDTIALAERITEDIRGHVEHIERLKEKLEAAQKQVDLDLLLADLASFLRDIPTKNMSESQRLRHSGLRKRLSNARAA